MSFDERNAAKRFIIFIDTLYDNAVKLIASAAGRAGRALQGATAATRPWSSTAPPRG